MAMNPELLKLVAQKKSKYAGNAGKAIKPKDGRNTYRITDTLLGKGQFWRDLGVHWIKASEEGKVIACVGDCDVVYQQPSVIATAIDMAISSATDEESKKLYESWKSRKTVLVNVIDRDDKSNTDLQPLELTTTTFGKILELYTLYGEAGTDICDPFGTTDIVITKTGKGLNTNYDVAISPKPGASLTQDQLDKAVDLDKFIETNFFRGEETKALNAIAQISGINLPRLGAPAKTPTPALTSPALSVAGATVESAPVSAPAPLKQAVVEAPPAPAVDPLEARRQEILKRQAAELAALEREQASAPQPAPEPTVTTTTALSGEADAILAELDALG